MIIFLFGEDTFRSRQKLKELKGKFKHDVDPDGSSIVVIDGEKASLESINEVVAAPSLFAKRRMIVIESIFKNKSIKVQEAVADYFKARDDKKEISNESNIIIFWDETDGEGLKTNKLFKLLTGQRFVQEFKPLSNTQAISWVKARAKKRGVTIRHQAAVHLTSLFGSDLWQLCNEINKLASFKRGQTPELVEGTQPAQIEVQDVDELARGSADENIFALTDAISNKNKAQALKLFEEEMKSGVTETYLLFMIIRQFKILMQVREGLDQGLTPRKLMSQLKLHPFVVQKSSTQVRKFTLPILKRIFQALVSIDRELKTGKADLRSSISLLIAKI